jgi:hypothetical protein
MAEYESFKELMCPKANRVLRLPETAPSIG